MSPDPAETGGLTILDRVARSPAGRWAAPAAAWLAYIVAFGPLYALLSTHTGIAAFVPVVVTAWCRGVLAGAAGGLATLPITALLSAAFGGDGTSSWLSQPALIGTGAMVLVGAVVGALRDLNVRLRAEVDKRHRAEQALRQRESRLALATDIERAMQSGGPIHAIIKAAVAGLHEHFPHVRSAYSTVDTDGRITIVYAVGPNELSWPDQTRTDLRLPGDCVETLRTRDLIAVDDVETDVETEPLAATLAGGDARACLDAPVRHSDSLLGLLSIDAATPHHWTAHERSTVREVADLLAVALSNAQSKRQLEESELKFRTLAESSHAVIALLQDKGTIYINPAFERISGYTSGELTHMELWEILRPDARALLKDRGERRLRGEDVPPHYETQIVTKSGQTRWLDVRVSSFELAAKPTSLITAIDITDRKRAEETIRESEARLRTLLDHYFDGIAVVVDGKSVYVNPTVCRMYGYDAHELLHRQPIDFVAPQHRERARQRVRELMDGAPEYPSEYEALRKDGSTFPVEVTSRHIQYGDKPALLSSLRDLTERNRAEAAIRESEQRFRALFEQAPIGIVLVGADTRFVRVNQAFCDMLGYSEIELIGKSFVDVSHADDAGGTHESARKVLADAESGVRYQKRYLTKDGGTVEAETTVSLTRDSEGRLLYAVAMIEDVTERRQLEEQLQQKQRLESVGQLAGGVAHNFNNALTAIIGYSELLGRRFDGEEAALKDVEQIQRVAEQSAALTRQLLAFSRKELVRPTVFSLNAAVESTSALLSPLIGEQVRLRLRLDRGLKEVRADRSQMEQVITNLVLNARDAMPDGGALTIATEQVKITAAQARTHPEARPGPYVRLTVTDTGTGMDHATVARIFEPFFTTKEPGEGVGLGLAMVHGAVKQSDGFVLVDTEPGRGSTFSLHLPAHQEPAAEPDTLVGEPAAH